MNKFFIRFTLFFMLLVNQIHAAQVPSLKDLCLRMGTKVNDEVLLKYLDTIPTDCLRPILAQKIAAKLFPLKVRVPIKKLNIPIGEDSVAITADGTKALSGSGDGMLRVWNLVENKSIDLPGHKEPIYSVAMTPNGVKAFSGLADGTLKTWDLINMKEIASKDGDSMILSVAMDSDGKKGLSGNKNGLVKIWDLTKGIQKIDTLNRDTYDPVLRVTMSADGAKGLSGSRDGTLKLWDLNTGQGITLIDSIRAIRAVTMTPDGKKGLSGSEDKIVRVWDLDTGQKIAEFSGHTHSVGAVAITADGAIGISGDSDGFIKIWNLINKKEIATIAALHEKANVIYSIAITPDGTKAVTGCEDAIKVWDLRPFILEQYPLNILKEAYVGLYRDNKTQLDIYREIVINFMAQDLEEEVTKRPRRW